MRTDVSILIVTFNSEKQIGACLRSVLAQRRSVAQQIIVLDNASTDATVELIRSEFPGVTLLTLGRNLGFAAGVNEAARHASGEFLLLLNPDTAICDHAIDVVVEFARANPRYGLYGGRTLKTDGSLEPSSCWGRPTLLSMALFACGLTALFPRNRFLDPESLGKWQRDTVREVGVITGCFLLVHHAVWEKLGGFDEQYFMYGEDVDLAMRARALGHRPVICPDARVVHEVGQSSAKPIDKMMLLFRGKAHLARVHWRGFAQQLAIFFLATGVALRALPCALRELIRPSVGHADRRLELWRRRHEWLPGYSNLRPSAAVSVSSAESPLI